MQDISIIVCDGYLKCMKEALWITTNVMLQYWGWICEWYI